MLTLSSSNYIWTRDGCSAEFELFNNPSISIKTSREPEVIEQITNAVLNWTNHHLEKCENQQINAQRVINKVKRINLSVQNALRR